MSNSRPRQWALPPHCECIICALPPPTLAGWRLASLQSFRAVPSLHTYLGIPAHLIEIQPFCFLHQLVVNIFARKNNARMLTISSVQRHWPCLLDRCDCAAVWQNLGNTGQHTSATRTIFIQPNAAIFLPLSSNCSPISDSQICETVLLFEPTSCQSKWGTLCWCARSSSSKAPTTMRWKWQVAKFLDIYRYGLDLNSNK